MLCLFVCFRKGRDSAPAMDKGSMYRLRYAMEAVAKPTATETPATVYESCSAAVSGVACASQHVRLVQKRDYAASIGTLFQDAARECAASVRSVTNQCQAANKPYFDRAFYFDRADVVYPSGTPADCTLSPPQRTARLSALYPSWPLFSKEVGGSLVKQGAVGDSYLLAAARAVASLAPAELRRLFVECNPTWGVYGVLFFKNGGWDWVIVDDIIAVKSDNSPLYASCGSQELWPMILEKAYAKLHGNWDALDGGDALAALRDLTGGQQVQLDLAAGLEWAKQCFEDPRMISSCELCPASSSPGILKECLYIASAVATTTNGTPYVRLNCLSPDGEDGAWKGTIEDAVKKELQASNPPATPGLLPDLFWMPWSAFETAFLPCVTTTRLVADGNEAVVYCAPPCELLLFVDTVVDYATVEATLEDPRTLSDHAVAKVRVQGSLSISCDLLPDGASMDSRTPMWSATTPIPTLCYSGALPAGTLLLGVKASHNHPGTLGVVVRASVPAKKRIGMARVDFPERVVSVGGELARGAPINAAKALGPSSSSHGERVAAPQPSICLHFNRAGGKDKAIATAFGLADPYHRGKIDRRMAEQAFAQLLMHSDLGMAFSDASAVLAPMDAGQFEALVADLFEQFPV